MVAAQSIYERILREPMKLTWLNIFQGLKEKHTQKDADYAMIAGTTLDTVSDEVGMIQKWQRPWLCRKVFLGLGAASLALAGVILAWILLTGVCQYPALNLLYFILPPAVVPLTLMLFFWEMNAPRNISLVDMIGFFFTGGVLSLFFTMLLGLLDLSSESFLAPLTEEPGKLLAALYCIKKIKKKNGKMYGLTGLAIGAAVGAGFAAFESAQYAYREYAKAFAQTLGENFETSGDELLNMMFSGWMWMDLVGYVRVTTVTLLRALCAFHGHVMYCAPYASIAALYIGNGDTPKQAITRPAFLISFAISFFCHMGWNYFSSEHFLITLVVITLVVWLNAQQAMRASFRQLVAKVPVSGGQAVGAAGTQTLNLTIQGISGVHGGVAFRMTRSEILVGSDQSCRLSYPVNTPGIAPQHCKLLQQNGGVYLADLGTPGGTWLNGSRCTPMKGYLLKSGDTFWLGSQDQSFRVV